jgi:very-short-patch-repair endonuclease
MLPYNRQLKQNSRALRSGMTDAEQKLWYRLRRKQINGWQFYRQKPIGEYIVDFYCPAARLVVELDGSQHFEPLHQAADRQRDAFLENLGLRVLRFDNRQVLLEIDAVVETIAGIPPGPPFTKGGADQSAHGACSNDKEATTSIPPFAKGGEAPLAHGACSNDKEATTLIPPFAKGGLGGIRDAIATNGEDKK